MKMTRHQNIIPIVKSNTLLTNCDKFEIFGNINTNQ